MADRKPPPKIEWDDDAAESIEWDDDAAESVDPTSRAAEPFGPEEAPLSGPARLREAAKRNPGLLRSLGSSALQGFFKSGSDEAVGGITRLAVDPGVGWKQADGSVKYLKEPADVYRAGRDTEREVLRGAQENYPKLSFAANMAGDLASDLVLGGFGVKGVGSKGYNTATGALSGLLGSDAELTPDKATAGDAASAGFSTLFGGTMGRYAPQVAQWGLRRITPAILSRLRAVSEKLAVSQGRRVLLSGADQLAQKKPTSPEAVLEALDSGAIVPGGTTQGAFKRLEHLSDERGAVYGSILKELEEAGVKGPDAEALARELVERGDAEKAISGASTAVPQVFWDEGSSLSEKAALPRAADALARLRLAGQGVAVPPAQVSSELPLSVAEGIKRNLQNQVKYGKIEDTPVSEAKQEVASRLREAIEESVQGAADAAPEGSSVQVLGDAFKPVKQRLARTLEARQASEKGAAAEAKRRGLSLTDYISMGMGRTPAEGLGIGALNNLLRNRGTSTVARGANALRRLARAGGRNPDLLNRELGAALSRTSEVSPQLAEMLADYLSPPDEAREEKERQEALMELLRQ